MGNTGQLGNWDVRHGLALVYEDPGLWQLDFYVGAQVSMSLYAYIKKHSGLPEYWQDMWFVCQPPSSGVSFPLTRLL